MSHRAPRAFPGRTAVAAISSTQSAAAGCVSPGCDKWKLRSYAEQERLKQVREVYGEQAYEEQKRAWERTLSR